LLKVFSLDQMDTRSRIKPGWVARRL
jgi:hypothetical protein